MADGARLESRLDEPVTTYDAAPNAPRRTVSLLSLRSAEDGPVPNDVCEKTNWRSIWLLLVIVFPECLGAEIARPFQYFQIKYVCGVEDGFLTGLAQAAFFGTFIFMNVLWGFASDRIGRKPLLVSSSLGNALGQIMFGMSGSFSMLLVSRLTSGFFACSSTIAKGMLGELTQPSSRGLAYAMYGATYGMAQIVGPVIGAYLAEFPVGPYQYLLPCLAVAVTQVLAALVAALVLPETPRSLAKRRAAGNVAQSLWRRLSCRPTSVGDASTVAKKPAAPGGVRQFFAAFRFNRYYWHVVSMYALAAFYTMGYHQLYNLMTSASVHNSGLGFTARQISHFMILYGVCKISWQLLAFPRVKQWIGEIPTHRIGACVFVTLILAMPFLRHYQDSTAQFVLLGTLTGLAAGVDAFAILAVTCLITESLPTDLLAVGHGACNMFVSVARGSAPMIVGALWDLANTESIREGFSILAHGRLVAFFLAVVAVIDIACSFRSWLPYSRLSSQDPDAAPSKDCCGGRKVEPEVSQVVVHSAEVSRG